MLFVTHMMDPMLDPNSPSTGRSPSRKAMLSSVIDSLRVFKGLHDLAFSDGFYAKQRAEFLEGFASYRPDELPVFNRLPRLLVN